MGFLARLLRKGQEPNPLEIATYEIRFSSDGRTAAVVRPSIPDLPAHEYIKLWAWYEVKNIYNLGGIQQHWAQVVLQGLERIAAHGIDPDVDYFRLASPGGPLRRAPAMADTSVHFHGAFYAYRHLATPGRFIKTHFPLRLPQHHTLHGGVALFHTAIEKNESDSASISWARCCIT